MPRSLGCNEHYMSKKFSTCLYERRCMYVCMYVCIYYVCPHVCTYVCLEPPTKHASHRHDACSAEKVSFSPRAPVLARREAPSRCGRRRQMTEKTSDTTSKGIAKPQQVIANGFKTKSRRCRGSFASQGLGPCWPDEHEKHRAGAEDAAK